MGKCGQYYIKGGWYYLDPTARQPRELDMEDGRRNNGISHGRKVTTGLDDRPEVEDCGPLPGFARSLQRIMRERGDTLSRPDIAPVGMVAREKSHPAYTL